MLVACAKSPQFPVMWVLMTVLMCQRCFPTTVVALTDPRNKRIVIAADSLVRREDAPPTLRCKIHVVTDDCTFAMVGMYKHQSPAFDLASLGQFACRSSGDLKDRADSFLSAALPKLADLVNGLEPDDAASLKRHYDGKPIVEVLFIGAYRNKPAVLVRGAIFEDGALKAETISVPSERVDVFAGVNGHIRDYVHAHPRWEDEGDIEAAQRMIEIEATAHPALVGLPISVGTVGSNGKFHWIQRGKCQ